MKQNIKSRFKIAEVKIDDIVFVEKNARFMEQTTFLQLVDNIRRDGQLSTVPFTILLEEGKNKGKYEVISGNHRVKAAKQAGITRLHVLYALESDISNDEKRAIQLSHNSIEGKDDAEILKQLMDEIVSLDYKQYAHIDESIFDEINSFDYDVIQPTNEVVNVNFVFFDQDKESMDELFEELYSIDDIENTYMVPIKEFDNFNAALSKIKMRYGVKSVGLGVVKMIELAKKQLEK